MHVIQNDRIVAGLVENQHVEFGMGMGARRALRYVLQRPPVILQRQNGVRMLNVRVIPDAKVHRNGDCLARKPRAICKHGANVALLFQQLELVVNFVSHVGKIPFALKVADQF